MDYLEGNIIKYVTRYKFKGGVDDLRKAEWYLKRLMCREALASRKPTDIRKPMPAGPDWPKAGEKDPYKPLTDGKESYVIPTLRMDDIDSAWPSPADCAKPLRLPDFGEHLDDYKEEGLDAAGFCCPAIDLAKEHKDEVLRETLQAMKDEECRSGCANYIRPYRF